MASELRIRLGTRASALARWQADWVAGRLRELGVEVEMIPISTVGDRRRQGSIGSMGEQGVFTKEIQRALLDDQIDLAVHSLKDLPTEHLPGLVLAAVPQREAVADALVCSRWKTLEELPQGVVVGSGSPRRKSQLLAVRPDLDIRDIRGNVDTRLAKLDAGDYDAIILATAGLSRLGFADRIAQRIPLETMLPAIGQGALGLETRQDDAPVRQRLGELDDPASHAAVDAERAMLLALRGGCLAPIAAWGRVEGGRLLLTGRVLSLDGRMRLETESSASIDAADELGRQVAESLLEQGAAKLVQAARDVG